ncbi:MAG: ATP-binding cassette domain-containing protein [Planctomycetes bacterium]|nr:ATP-binding cassette domain-containing protein [Planctomycetota bacterium]
MSGAATETDAAVAEPAVVLERVSHWYGAVIGLNDVSLRFERGVTGLLGPNGAGKSTLMRLMTGQMAPSQGDVRVFGQLPFANPAVLGRLGHSPEHEQLWDHLDGAAHLFALLHYGGFPAADARERAARSLARVGLASAGSKKCGAYSKGMRQRLRIAQAIAHDPELIVLDEPLNGLDPVGRREIIDLVRGLGTGGHTVVVSGHVLHEVEKMTRRIALVHKGRVLAEGTIDEIRRALDQRPHHVRVATDDPRGLARLLLEEPGVLSVRVAAAEARFEVTDPGSFFDRLARITADGHMVVREYESTDDNLQAIFDYLVA